MIRKYRLYSFLFTCFLVWQKSLHLYSRNYSSAKQQAKKVFVSYPCLSTTQRPQGVTHNRAVQRHERVPDLEARYRNNNAIYFKSPLTDKTRDVAVYTSVINECWESICAAHRNKLEDATKQRCRGGTTRFRKHVSFCCYGYEAINQAVVVEAGGLLSHSLTLGEAAGMCICLKSCSKVVGTCCWLPQWVSRVAAVTTLWARRRGGEREILLFYIIKMQK